jgi:mobilization protein NikA
MAREERSEIIMVRVTPRDKRAFEEAATELDMKVSEFLRSAGLIYLAISGKGHGLRMVAKGARESIREAMQKLREPGLRKIVFG